MESLNKRGPSSVFKKIIKITVKHSSHKISFFFEALIALQLYVPVCNSPVGDKCLVKISFNVLWLNKN